MRVIWLLAIIHSVLSLSTTHGFGTSYLKNNKLCEKWSCINSKLGLRDALPPKDQYANVLKSLLPKGSWQESVQKVLDTCYGDRKRRYTNTCPGQALLHCTFDQLIQNCPNEYQRKDDGCAQLTSLAGFKYMFAQSRYDDLEKHLPTERRPAWFMKNYFNSKCCDVPEVFNSTVLAECGFMSVITYYTHPPRRAAPATVVVTEAESVKIVDIDGNTIEAAPAKEKDVVKVVDLPATEANNPDPLDCCNMDELLHPSWRADCRFQLSWSRHGRLAIANNVPPTTTERVVTTPRPRVQDVKVVPLKCDVENCVFRQLNIVSDQGTVDKEAFSRLLDNMTSANAEWTKAKARVVTECLTKTLRYPGDCEINKILSCTFDVLSENCPYAKGMDPCRHINVLKKNITCQVSSTKYRPKNRRQFCGIPTLVSQDVLSRCGVSSLSQQDYVLAPPSPPKKHSWVTPRFACKELTPSTSCVLNKMGAINKYGFMDYFKMKDHIRRSTAGEWSALTDVYLNMFNELPLYREHCSSPKKLLNVLDTMLITCPISKRKSTQQCNKLFEEITNEIPDEETTKKFDRLWEHRQPLLPVNQHSYSSNFPVNKKKVHKTPTYDFGLLGSENAPKVEIIDIKPAKKPDTYENRKPIVLLPVYLRPQAQTLAPGKTSLQMPMWRSQPLARSHV